MTKKEEIGSFSIWKSRSFSCIKRMATWAVFNKEKRLCVLLLQYWGIFLAQRGEIGSIGPRKTIGVILWKLVKILQSMGALGRISLQESTQNSWHGAMPNNFHLNYSITKILINQQFDKHYIDEDNDIYVLSQRNIFI